jgi:hypothetical protein
LTTALSRLSSGAWPRTFNGSSPPGAVDVAIGLCNRACAPDARRLVRPGAVSAPSLTRCRPDLPGIEQNPCATQVFDLSSRNHITWRKKIAEHGCPFIDAAIVTAAASVPATLAWVY